MMYFDEDEVIEYTSKKKKLTKGSVYKTNNVPMNYSYMEIEGNYTTDPVEPKKKKVFSCSFVTLFLYALAIGLFFYVYSVRRHSSSTPSDKHVDSGDSGDSIVVNNNENNSNDYVEPVVPVETTSTFVKPNIVFILTDDQGMGDMDLTGNDLVGLMPNIKALNYAGLNFTQHYVHTQCSPSRAALLTGLYSTSNGMYHSDIQGTQPWGLSLTHKLMPEYLLKAGFRSSYHLGKWHLGHYSDKHIPTARGFNFSLGYYGGFQHPTNYKYEWIEFATGNSDIPDMHLNGHKYESTAGEEADYFNSYLITDIAEAVIFQEGIVQKTNAARGVQEPFFMLFAPPLISAPVMPDDSMMSNYKLSYIKDEWRRKTAGMLMMLDAIVGRVVKALDTAGLTDNTVIIFTSDNGAVCAGNHNGAGSNYPLRGCKGSVFEGAARVPAFVYSPLLGHSLTLPGRQNTGLFHISDWLPTIVEGMLGRTDILPSSLDGINQFPWMLSFTDPSKAVQVAANFASSSSKSPPRTEVVYNIDPYSGVSAIRVGNYKLILNETTSTGWFNSTHFGRELCNGVWITVTDPTGIPSLSPSRKPTTPQPTRKPTTHAPTVSIAPTAPTVVPTTAAPTAPTYQPTHVPTRPTIKPSTHKPSTRHPSAHPSAAPSNATFPPTTHAPTAPTYRPTRVPTRPTVKPTTASPTRNVTTVPTLVPSAVPSTLSSLESSAHPTPSNVTSKPSTLVPTAPTILPSHSPTAPTHGPTQLPSTPTLKPSSVSPLAPTPGPSSSTVKPITLSPTLVATASPTSPTVKPSSAHPSSRPPSVRPSIAPSAPTAVPTTLNPTAPSHRPTRLPTAPTRTPSSARPSAVPSCVPSMVPSVSLSSAPSITSSFAPSTTQSGTPSASQTSAPSLAVTPTPSVGPTSPPTFTKSLSPSVHPSVRPSRSPTVMPSKPTSAAPSTFRPSCPTNLPFRYPTRLPTAAATSASPSPTRGPTTAPSLHSSSPTSQPVKGLPSASPVAVQSSSPSSPSAHSSSSPTIKTTIAPTVRSTVAPTVKSTASPTPAPFPKTSHPTKPTATSSPTLVPTTGTPFYTIASKSPAHLSSSRPTKRKSLRENRKLDVVTTTAAVASESKASTASTYITNSVLLFDLSTDEQERHDISSKYPDVVASLKAKLLKYKSKMSARASCDVSDSTAETLWKKDNSIEPWITLTSKTDYVCPVSAVTSVNCEWV